MCMVMHAFNLMRSPNYQLANHFSEPPFHIRLINSSPRVSRNDVLIDFIGSMPIKSARCFLTGQPEQECK